MAWSLKASGSGISDNIVGGNLGSKANQAISSSYTLDTSKAGTYTVNLSGDVTDADGTFKEISDSVTVKVSEKTITTNNNNNNNTENTGTTTSNNNKPQTSTTTKPTTTEPSTPEPKEPKFTAADETVYATGNINIRKSYSTDSDIIGTLEKDANIQRTGVGDNGWSKVTYNGKTGYIKSNLLTTQEPAKSADKALKTLEIVPEGLDPQFNSETTNYTLIVGSEIETLQINAVPNDEKATVEITGNESLQIGDNMVKINVTAEDGTTRTYNIDVKRQESTVLALTNIKINGYTLSPKFSPDVYEYKISIFDANVNNLDITAVANDENAIVQVFGNTNFKDGENVVEIAVTSENNEEKVVYKLYVNKNAIATTTKSDNNNKMIMYVGIGSAIFIILLIIIILITRKRKHNKEDEPDYNDYSDLYGYSSKNKTDESSKLVNSQEENLSKQELKNKLFGELPQNNNEEIAEENTRNEEKFNYNTNINENYQYRNNAQNESLYSNNTTSEDFSFRSNAKIDSIYNNENSISNEKDSNTSMIETTNTTDYEDYYKSEDNYKTKKSRGKGKHSK